MAKTGGTVTVTVRALWKDCDFRKINHWRGKAEKFLATAPTNQVVLGLNKARTRARLFDVNGNFYAFYAGEEEQFDVTAIDQLVKAMRLTLVIPASVRAENDQLASREPVKKAS